MFICIFTASFLVGGVSMDYGGVVSGVFDCTCNTQNSLLLNQHNGDDAL